MTFTAPGCRPPSYQLMTTAGLQVTALPHQLTVPEQQKGSDKSHSAQVQQQNADIGPQSSVEEQPNPFLMQASAPSPPPPPPAFFPDAPQHQSSSAGEGAAKTGMSGHSDMSQALLFNTAALYSNLAAAQRGDDIEISAEADELHDADARGMAPQFAAPSPNDAAITGAGAIVFWHAVNALHRQDLHHCWLCNLQLQHRRPGLKCRCSHHRRHHQSSRLRQHNILIHQVYLECFVPGRAASQLHQLCMK